MTRINDQAIDQLFADHRSTYGGVRNDYFAPLFLQQEHEVGLERALRQTTFGGRDYGFDAFHFNRDNHNLYLFQFKWSDDPSGFKESYRRMLDAGLDRIFVGSHQDQAQNQAVLQIKSCLLENKAVIEGVFIRFVFRGQPRDAENSTALAKLQEDLESKKYMIDAYFGREVNFVIDYRSSHGHVGGISSASKTHRYTFELADRIEQLGPQGQRLHVGSVSLYDLNAMFEEMGQRFLDRNIRSGLAGDEAPNRAITRALRDIVLDERLDPAVFLFNHTGVALYAQDLQETDGRVEVTEPRLLNGAQTVTTFNRFLKKHSDHPKIGQNRDRLKAIKVLCRILTDATDEFVISVTVNNNRQNPVKPWALRANDFIQLELADKFQTDLRRFYERQENAFHNLTDDDLHRMEIEPQKAIELRRLAVTFLISDGEIDRASRLPEVFEDDKSYAQVFGPQRLSANSNDILLCYKIQFRITRLAKEIVERGAKKYSFAQKARNLVWALVFQAMRNDPAYEDQRERFGESLTIEAGFSEWMQAVASSRVRHLLSDLAAHPPYRAKLDEERYDFLRSKAAFDFCMEKAHKRWRWVHYKLKG